MVERPRRRRGGGGDGVGSKAEGCRPAAAGLRVCGCGDGRRVGRKERDEIKSPSKFKALTLPKMKSCQKRKRMCQCAEPPLPRWWGEDEGGREEREREERGETRERHAGARAHGLSKPLSESRQRVKPATG
jgi:hypothetical protein